MEEAEGASPGKAKLTAAELSRRARRISIEQEANAERARLRLTRHDLENLIANAGAERPLQSKAEVHGEVQFASKIDDVAKRHEALTAGLGRYLGERLLELQTELEAARLETYFSNPGVHEQLKPQLRAEHEALNGALQGLLHTVYASFSQALDAFVQTQKDWSSAQATIIGSVHALARELYVDSIAQARGRDTAARSTATSRVEQVRARARGVCARAAAPRVARPRRGTAPRVAHASWRRRRRGLLLCRRARRRARPRPCNRGTRARRCSRSST